jgi:hypothetical protein
MNKIMHSSVVLLGAWVVLYLSSYGVLVQSEELEQSKLRCTYFIATEVHSVDYDRPQRQLCPRLWGFGQ